ncbi:hypothetical protein [Novosphingobium sp.]|uniref:hypothetical protein n=1 Tax=Novosphingobium sp. TaxID=1874826 RepID=UPI0027339413|nr:hypothetical protein [Novosphingobium sp.]MDP3907692.1 hypothetical protein [Novosphingobium sp.]
MEENQGVTSAFAEDRPRLSEQEQYKRLIAAELARQNLPLGHLADRIGLLRTRLHKIIRKTGLLTEDLRDQLFAELAIDHVRAKISVVLLQDPDAYAEQSVFLAAEALKAFYYEVATCRSGEIHVDLRPAIIHLALHKTYEMLLIHQERVLEHDRDLQV